jgi:serine/threonine protein kinase
MNEAPVKPGDTLAGKYRVERVLGNGAMGVVVAARHVDLDRLVALKFIIPQRGGRRIRRRVSCARPRRRRGSRASTSAG